MNINTTFSRNAILFILLSLFLSTAFAQTEATASGEFTLQGKLTTTDGTPIADGQHTLVLKVYTEGSASAFFTETDNVMTTGGLFSTMVGDNGTSLSINSSTNYQLGVTVDGQAELSPRISLGSSLKSITAELAANAEAVNGFSVSLSGNPQPNTLLALDSTGMISGSLLTGVVTGINGTSGNVVIQGGGNLAVNTSGNTINLSFTGSDSGGFNLPFAQTLNLTSGTGLSITNTLGGTAASFINTGLGTALMANATTGAAINATSNSSLAGTATIQVSNTAGTAINAVSTTAGGAVLTLRNLSTSDSADLLTAVNGSGSTAFSVAGNGQTTINATVDNALDVHTTAGTAINAVTNASNDATLTVKNMAAGANAKLIAAMSASDSAVFNVAASGKTTIAASVADALDVTTSAAGATALKVTGGLKFIGAAGTGTVSSGQTQVTINNALATANSVILLTVNGGGVNAVPLRISSQGSGSFVVSVFSGVTSLLGDVSFNYLIINQ